MATNVPYNQAFGYAGGRREDCMIGVDHLAIPVTLWADRLNPNDVEEKRTGPRLYVRGTDSAHNCYEFCPGGIISSVSNVGGTARRIVLTGTNDVYRFKVGDTVSLFDQSAGDWHATETAAVIQVSGQDKTIVLDTTLSPNPAAGDYICVNTNGIGGSEASARACVILEDIVQTSGETPVQQTTKAYIKGTFNKALVGGATYTYSSTAYNLFVQHNNQVLQLIDVQEEA